MSVKSVVEHLLHHGFPKDEETKNRLVAELHVEPAPALSVVSQDGTPSERVPMGAQDASSPAAEDPKE